MAWSPRLTVSDLRRELLRQHAAGISVNELTRSLGVSRATAYRLIATARLVGVDAAVVDESRAPLHSPHALDAGVQELLLGMHAQYGWGAKKLVTILSEAFDGTVSRTAVANLLRRHALVREFKPALKHEDVPLTAATACNHVWAIDFKGPMGPRRLEPLTIVDHHSRYWLCCGVFCRQTYEDTRGVMEEVFRQYGIPRVIRVDAGNPWIAVSTHRLTRLSAWWVALGIHVEVAPSCQQNGIVERLHGTMESEMAISKDTDALSHFVEHRHLYNAIRPHESLEMQCPAEVYTRSKRTAKERIADYDDDAVRSVGNRGEVNWRGHLVFISDALTGRRVGIRQVGTNEWVARYFNIPIRTFSTTDG